MELQLYCMADSILLAILTEAYTLLMAASSWKSMAP